MSELRLEQQNLQQENINSNRAVEDQRAQNLEIQLKLQDVSQKHQHLISQNKIISEQNFELNRRIQQNGAQKSDFQQELVAVKQAWNEKAEEIAILEADCLAYKSKLLHLEPEIVSLKALVHTLKLDLSRDQSVVMCLVQDVVGHDAMASASVQAQTFEEIAAFGRTEIQVA